MKSCTKCGKTKEFADFNKDKQNKDGHRYWCRKCSNEASTKTNRANGHIAMNENKTCGAYLGVAIAEKLVRHLFKDVQKMRNGNPNFDFICNRNKKIDVKSSCITLRNKKKYPYWQFDIRKNTIADYFLLLAFNTRADLEPQHQWLIPGHVLNHLKSSAVISLSTINKWDDYRQDIGKAVICCNTMKENWR